MRRKLWTVGIMLAAGVICGAFLFMHSAYFTVNEIIIKGNERVDSDQILLTSGIYPGINYFQVSAKRVKAAVGSIPWIEHVDVKKGWPRSITISVKEREPFALMQYHNAFLLLDKDAYVIELARADDLQRFPLVSGPLAGNCIIGEVVPSLQIRLAVLALRDFAAQATSVSEVHVDEDLQTTVYLMDGMYAFLGQAGITLASKIGYLKEILQDIRKNHLPAEYIDLRQEKPLVKLKGQPAPVAAGEVRHHED